MSGLAKFVFPLQREMWLEVWQQANERSQRPDREDAPSAADVRYIGVMSSNYPKLAEPESFIPVDSAAELYRLIPEHYGYVGSQIAGHHVVRGKMALPYPWGESYVRLSTLACGAIRVLVAFALTQLTDEPELITLPDSAERSNLLERASFHPERWEEPFDLYDWLCGVYYKMHSGTVHYNHTDDWWKIKSETKMVSEFVSNLFSSFCTPAGKRAFEILNMLADHYDRNWCDGLRELGNEVGLHDKGMFGESPLFQLWLLAVQQEFEVAARKAIAEHVWCEEYDKKRRDQDDD
jgi:hypothetical protein